MRRYGLVLMLFTLIAGSPATVASKAARTPKATATPTPTPTATPAPAATGLWLSPERVAALPTAGTGWSHVKAVADGSLGVANIADQDNLHGTRVFAVALVWARTGKSAYREKARAALMSAIGTEAGTRTLALGRNVAAYVLAADLIGLSSLSPSDDGAFRSWLGGLRTRQNSGHSRWVTLNGTSENTANNWGAFALASRIAIDLYLGDTTDLARAARIHLAYADRGAYPAGQPWGPYFQPTMDFDPANWACGDTTTWVAINPDCVKNGHAIGGSLVEEISRETANVTAVPQPAGSPGMSYSWETLQALIVQAELLRRAGHPTLWDASGQALLRAANFMQRAGWQETWSVTTHVPWLINARYGTAFPVRTGGYGRLVGFTDWTHGS